MASMDPSTIPHVYCDECNTFIDSNVYTLHVQGKKHQKNACKRKKSWRTHNETGATKPKFVLEEPASLDIQFRSFLNQVLLTREECSSTTSRILQDLEPCLMREFGWCHPYVFGSMSTGLALVGSDIDIYLDTGIYNRLLTLSDPKPELQRAVSRCTRALRTDDRFSQIIPISQARVPIVKFVHKQTGLSCDVSFKDSLGVHNSRLLHFYLFLHPRFYEVMVAIKFWGKEYGLCGADSISSYGWTLLFISFLQTLKLPDGSNLVPSVSELQPQGRPHPSSMINGWRVDFYPKQNFVVLPDEAQFSYLGLLKGFFDYYRSFPFQEYIVCPFLGQPIPWCSLVDGEVDAFPPECQWYQSQLTSLFSDKVTNHHIVCIQDPFQHDFLLGASCSRKKFEKILVYLNAAARICQTEEELADPNASKFLTSLFTFQLEEIQEKISIRLREYIGVRRQDLYLEAFCMLEDIFSKIMKFEMRPEPGGCLRSVGEPDTKVPKKIETQDVHQRNDPMAMERKYYCVAIHPVWYFRKNSRKEVKLSFPETAFEFETKLSDVIVNHDYPSERVEFSCQVGVKKSQFSLEVVLKQSDGQNSKKLSRELFQFLRNNLQSWMKNFLHEKLTEPSTLLSLRSGACSSTDDHNDVEVDDSENGDVKEVQSHSESGTPCEDSNSSLETVGQSQLENCNGTLEES